MSVKDRIKIFIKSQKIKQNVFEESINASNGYINSISKSIGIDKLNAIIEKYPILNIEWLLTGKGEMLRGDQPKREENKTDNGLKDKIIYLLEQENERLKTELEEVKRDKEKTVKTH